MKRILNIEIDIPEEEMSFFNERMKIYQLTKGEYFHEADKVCNEIGIIKSGLLKSFVINEKYDEKIIEFYHENTFVSAFTSFITKEKTDWNIQAIEDSEILIITEDLLNELYQRHPNWIKFGMEIFKAQTLKKCNREKSLLVDNATERYQIFRKQYKVIENRIPLNQIALYLGIRPESLSRIRKEIS